VTYSFIVTKLLAVEFRIDQTYIASNLSRIKSVAHHTHQLIWTTPNNYIANNKNFVVNSDCKSMVKMDCHYTVDLSLPTESILASFLAFCDKYFRGKQSLNLIENKCT